MYNKINKRKEDKIQIDKGSRYTNEKVESSHQIKG